MQGFYSMQVNSAVYGTGKIKDWDGKTITVRFGHNDVHFWFPKVFEVGVISTTNDADEELIREMIDRRIMAVIERERTSLDEEPTEESVNALAVSLKQYFRNCYSVEFLKEKIYQSKEEERRRKIELAEARAAAEKNIEPSPSPAATNKANTPVTASPSQGSEKVTKPKRKGEIRISFGDATFVVGVILSVLSLCGLILIPIGGAIGLETLLFVGLAIFLVVGFLAHCVTNGVNAYLSANNQKGAKKVISLICFIISFFPYYLLILFVSCAIFVVKTFVGLIRDNFGASSSKEKAIKIHDEYGNIRILKKSGTTYVGSILYDRYRDDIGNYWLSIDKRNFTRENRTFRHFVSLFMKFA